MNPLLLSLPDELLHWRGTAAELADRCNETLARVPTLAEDAGSANERLIRHYVQVGALTAPEREGREALFGFRQIVEYLTARFLLRDGWPLAKVAEIVRATDTPGLAELLPVERPRTPAEDALARLRRGTKPTGRVAREPASDYRQPETARQAATSPRGANEPGDGVEISLNRAVEISRRRVSLEENLKALGNADGRPARQQLLRLDLTPWCQVHIDLAHLNEMSEDTPATLGAALTEALLEERIRRGKKP
jgi:DNA-binding transcriptional MerR regulator